MKLNQLIQKSSDLLIENVLNKKSLYNGFHAKIDEDTNTVNISNTGKSKGIHVEYKEVPELIQLLKDLNRMMK